MAGWVPYAAPLPSAVVARAKALLGELELGEWQDEEDPTDPSRDVRYIADTHAPSKSNPQPHLGISVWREAAKGAPMSVDPVVDVDQDTPDNQDVNPADPGVNPADPGWQ